MKPQGHLQDFYHFCLEQVILNVESPFKINIVLKAKNDQFMKQKLFAMCKLKGLYGKKGL